MGCDQERDWCSKSFENCKSCNGQLKSLFTTRAPSKAGGSELLGPLLAESEHTNSGRTEALDPAPLAFFAAFLTCASAAYVVVTKYSRQQRDEFSQPFLQTEA